MSMQQMVMIAITAFRETLAWKTIAKVNASRFSPGDQILFKRGEVWREEHWPPSSGTPSNQIIIGAYGSGNNPVITGAALVKNWELTASNMKIWQANLAELPNIVLFDRNWGKKMASKTALQNERDWYYENGVLFICSTTDPNIFYTNPGVEASQRNSTLVLSKRSYIIVQDMVIEMANIWSNVQISGIGGVSIKLLRCEVRYGAGNGITIYGDSGGGHLIEECVIHNNLVFGINGYLHKSSNLGNETIIRNNKVFGNNKGGIEIRANYWVIERNKVYDNGDPNAPYMGIHIFQVAHLKVPDFITL